MFPFRSLTPDVIEARERIHAQALERARREFPHAQDEVKRLYDDHRWFLRFKDEIDFYRLARSIEP